jgi:hypothetical protein
LTPAVQDGTCAALLIAAPAKDAAEAQGIPERTYYDWLRKGAQGIQPYEDFALAVRRAKAQAVLNLVALSLAGGPGWRQALWLLERRFPAHYGRHARVERVPGVQPAQRGRPRHSGLDSGVTRGAAADARANRDGDRRSAERMSEGAHSIGKTRNPFGQRARLAAVHSVSGFWGDFRGAGEPSNGYYVAFTGAIVWKRRTRLGRRCLVARAGRIAAWNYNTRPIGFPKVIRTWPRVAS